MVVVPYNTVPVGNIIWILVNNPLFMHTIFILDKVLTRNPNHINYLSYGSTTIIIIVAHKIAWEYVEGVNMLLLQTIKEFMSWE